MYAISLHGLVIVEMLRHDFKYVRSMGKRMLFNRDDERNGCYVDIRGLGIINSLKAIFGLNTLEARIGTYSIRDDESETYDFNQAAIYISPEETLLNLGDKGPVTCAETIRKKVISIMDRKTTFS